MSVLEIGIAYFLVVAAIAVIGMGICMSARHGDDELRRALRERRQDRTRFPLAPHPDKPRIRRGGGFRG
jgi:hypothetical protein